MSLQKSNIEYLTHGWNFYTGCNHWRTGICPVAQDCWAKQMADRFHKGDFAPRLKTELLLAPLSLRKPARIGVCFTGDLFGDWVNQDELVMLMDSLNGWALGKQLWWWVQDIIRGCPQHQFLFLTKAPWNIQKWDEWPDNAWLGMTACDMKMLSSPLYANLARVKGGHKWISFEPLLGHILLESRDLKDTGIEWVVIGGHTGRHPFMPKRIWIDEIIDACRQAGIPYWIKNNLRPFFGDDLTQELPPELILKGVDLVH